MHHLGRGVRWIALAAALLASLASLLGCAGELPRKDGRVSKESAVPADTWRWPDSPKPSPDWPAPSDGYTPAPFGCVVDADCFGQSCCPTAWGVRLCAPACGR